MHLSHVINFAEWSELFLLLCGLNRSGPPTQSHIIVAAQLSLQLILIITLLAG